MAPAANRLTATLAPLAKAAPFAATPSARGVAAKGRPRAPAVPGVLERCARGRKGAPSHDAGRWTKADALQSETRTSQEGSRWSENADLTCETSPFDGPLSASPAFPQFKSMRILRWRSMRLRLEVKSALSDHLNVRTAFSDQKRGRKATISQRGERRRGRQAGRDEAAERGGAKRGREAAGRGEKAGTVRRGERRARERGSPGGASAKGEEEGEGRSRMRQAGMSARRAGAGASHGAEGALASTRSSEAGREGGRGLGPGPECS